MTVEWYTSDKLTVSNFVKQSAVDYIRYKMDYTPSEELVEFVYECASTRVKFRKQFEIVCRQTVGTGKKG